MLIILWDSSRWLNRGRSLGSLVFASAVTLWFLQESVQTMSKSCLKEDICIHRSALFRKRGDPKLLHLSHPAPLKVIWTTKMDALCWWPNRFRTYRRTIGTSLISTLAEIIIKKRGWVEKQVNLKTPLWWAGLEYLCICRGFALFFRVSEKKLNFQQLFVCFCFPLCGF